MKRFTPTADHAHQVLEPEAEPRGAVLLGDGHVDHLVRLQHVAVDGPLFQPLAAERHLHEFALVDKLQLHPQVMDGPGDAAARVAMAGLIEAVVEDFDRLGPRVENLHSQRPDHIRVGVGRLLRHAVEPDVRFEHHTVAPGDEPLHAAQRRHGLAHQRLRLTVTDHHQIVRRRPDALVGAQLPAAAAPGQACQGDTRRGRNKQVLQNFPASPGRGERTVGHGDLLVMIPVMGRRDRKSGCDPATRSRRRDAAARRFRRPDRRDAGEFAGTR